MSLTPISRDSMRIRRAERLEEQRKQQIQQTVKNIYITALRLADNTEDSKCFYEFPAKHVQVGQPQPDFLKTNMAEILDEVRTLFPGCSVEHTRMATARDGKKYDVTKIDEKLTPFIMQHSIVECIVVDWSLPAI